MIGIRNQGNFNVVTLGELEFAFSYETLIGVKKGGPWIVAKNRWGSTTGRHINSLTPQQEERVEADALQRVAQALIFEEVA